MKITKKILSMMLTLLFLICFFSCSMNTGLNGNKPVNNSFLTSPNRDAIQKNYKGNEKNLFYEELASVLARGCKDQSLKNVIKNKVLEKGQQSSAYDLFYSDIKKQVLENGLSVEDYLIQILATAKNISIETAGNEWLNKIALAENLAFILPFDCNLWTEEEISPLFSFYPDVEDQTIIGYKGFTEDGSAIWFTSENELDMPVIYIIAVSDKNLEITAQQNFKIQSRSVTSTDNNEEYITKIIIPDVRKIAPWRQDSQDPLEVTLQFEIFSKSGWVNTIYKTFSYDNYYTTTSGALWWKKTTKHFYDLTNKVETCNDYIGNWSRNALGDSLTVSVVSLKPDRHLDKTITITNEYSNSSKFSSKLSPKVTGKIPGTDVGFELGGEFGYEYGETEKYTYTEVIKELDLPLSKQTIDFYESYNRDFGSDLIQWTHGGNRIRKVILFPSMDTQVSNAVSNGISAANDNYKTVGTMRGTVWTIKGVKFNIRSLIQFDFQNIPSVASIDKAELTLFGVAHNPLTTSNAFYLERVNQPWRDSSATWNNQPTIYSSATSEVYKHNILGIKSGKRIINNQIYADQSTNATQNYYLNLTNWVYAWVVCKNSDSINFGFRLKLVDETKTYTEINFASKDNTNTALIPELYLEYK